MTGLEQGQGQRQFKQLKYRFEDTHQTIKLTNEISTQTEEQEQEQGKQSFLKSEILQEQEQEQEQARGLVYMARYKNYIYIGSTNRDLRRRISEHKKELKRGRKNKLYHFLKYEGFENFKFLIIEDHINLVDLKMKELFYYNLFVKDPLFNILNERQPIRTKEYKLMYDRLLYKKRIEYFKNYYKAKKIKLEAIKQGLITIDR
jgi:hypothetical protein